MQIMKESKADKEIGRVTKHGDGPQTQKVTSKREKKRNFTYSP